MRWRFVFSEMAIGLRRNLSMTIATILGYTVLFAGVTVWRLKQKG